MHVDSGVEYNKCMRVSMMSTMSELCVCVCKCEYMSVHVCVCVYGGGGGGVLTLNVPQSGISLYKVIIDQQSQFIAVLEHVPTYSV